MWPLVYVAVCSMGENCGLVACDRILLCFDLLLCIVLYSPHHDMVDQCIHWDRNIGHWSSWSILKPNRRFREYALRDVSMVDPKASTVDHLNLFSDSPMQHVTHVWLVGVG